MLPPGGEKEQKQIGFLLVLSRLDNPPKTANTEWGTLANYLPASQSINISIVEHNYFSTQSHDDDGTVDTDSHCH